MGNGHHSGEKIVMRLTKIEGHIRGIQKMVQEGKPCSDVLHQIAAVQSALAAAGKLLFEDHFQHCIIDKISNSTLRDELLQFKETMETFSRGMR